MPKSTPVYVTPNAVRKQHNGSGPDGGKGATTGPSTPTTPGGGNYRRDFAQGILPHSVASSDSEVSAPNTRPGSRTKHRSRYYITDTTGLITAVPVYPIRGRLLSRRFRRKRTGILIGVGEQIQDFSGKFHRTSRVRFRAPGRRWRHRGPRVARCCLFFAPKKVSAYFFDFRSSSDARRPDKYTEPSLSDYRSRLQLRLAVRACPNPYVDPFTVQQFTCFAPFITISSLVLVKQTMKLSTRRRVRIFARSRG